MWTELSLKEWILIVATGMFLVYTNSVHASGDIITSYDVSTDSDYATVEHISGGYSNVFAGWRLGLNQGRYDIYEKAVDTSAYFNETQFTFNRDFSHTVSLGGNVSSLYNNDWDLFIGSTYVGYKITPKWRVDVSAERNFIDSIAGIENEIAFNEYSASTDYIIDSVTLVGAYSRRDVSDGNTRDKTMAKILYNPPALKNWQFEARVTDSTYLFDAPEYWAPVQFNQKILGVRYRTKIDTWDVQAYHYNGIQTEDGNSGPFREYGFELSGWAFKNVYLDFYGSYMETRVYNRSSAGIRLNFVL